LNFIDPFGNELEKSAKMSSIRHGNSEMSTHPTAYLTSNVLPSFWDLGCRNKEIKLLSFGHSKSEER